MYTRLQDLCLYGDYFSGIPSHSGLPVVCRRAWPYTEVGPEERVGFQYDTCPKSKQESDSYDGARLWPQYNPPVGHGLQELS